MYAAGEALGPWPCPDCTDVKCERCRTCALCGALVAPGEGGWRVGPFPALHGACAAGRPLKAPAENR